MASRSVVTYLSNVVDKTGLIVYLTFLEGLSYWSWGLSRFAELVEEGRAKHVFVLVCIRRYFRRSGLGPGAVWSLGNLHLVMVCIPGYIRYDVMACVLVGIEFALTIWVGFLPTCHTGKIILYVL